MGLLGDANATMIEAVAKLKQFEGMCDQLRERVAFLEKQNAQLIDALAQPRTIVNYPDPINPFAAPTYCQSTPTP